MGNSLSSHYRAIIIYGKGSVTRHSASSGLHNNKSEVTRQGQLGKVEESIEILEREKIPETEH